MKNSKKPAGNSPSRWPLAAAIFALALVLLQVYGPALSGAFLFDDLYLPFLRPDAATRPLLDWLSVRPLVQFSYWVNFQLSALEPFSYHFFNLLFHAASGFLVWRIARKLLAPNALLPAFAAAVFLLHPLQTESVSYIASRSELLSALFLLAAWTAFLYRRELAIRFSEVALVLFFFLLALASKEHTVVLPALLLLHDYFFNPGFTLEGIRRNWRLYAPLFVAAILGVGAVYYFVLRGAATAGFGVKGLSPLDYLFTQFRSLVTYLRLFLFPIGLNADHDTPISHSLGDHLSWLCLLILLALSAAAWIYRKKLPLAAFGFFSFLLLLAPTSSIVPIADVLVERRMYLAVFPLTLAVIDVLRQRPLPAPVFAILCAVLAFLTWQRNHAWAGPIELWTSTVAESPEKFRPHFQLAFALYQAGNCPQALPEFEAAAKYAPSPSYELHVDWALAADCANQPATALAQLQTAIKIEPSAHAWALTGMVYAKQGDFTRALDALAQAEKIRPQFAMTYFYRGNIHQARGEWDAAIAQFQKAAALDPNDRSALDAIARVQAARPKP